MNYAHILAIRKLVKKHDIGNVHVKLLHRQLSSTTVR